MLKTWHEVRTAGKVMDAKTRESYLSDEEFMDAYDFCGPEFAGKRNGYKNMIQKYRKESLGSVILLNDSLQTVFGYKVGDFISEEEVVAVLHTRSCELKREANFDADDINKYCKARKSRPTINGKRVRGYVIESFDIDAIKPSESLSEALKQAEVANNINSHKKASTESKKGLTDDVVSNYHACNSYVQASIKFGCDDELFDQCVELPENIQ
jgi:hypothetical protein